MKIYKITFNIDRLLPRPYSDKKRWFADLRAANHAFNTLAQSLNYDMDDWIQLDRLEVGIDGGEYHVSDYLTLRLLSDSIKIGIDFNPEDFVDPIDR